MRGDRPGSPLRRMGILLPKQTFKNEEEKMDVRLCVVGRQKDCHQDR